MCACIQHLSVFTATRYILCCCNHVDDKELLECMTALQQAVDPKQLCELVTTSLNKSNVLLNKVVAAMDGEH